LIGKTSLLTVVDEPALDGTPVTTAVARSLDVMTRS
jgi:hypothetical protein